MRFQQFVWIILLHALLIAGCQPGINEPPISDADYMPLETGWFIIYDVEEQRYSLSTAPILLRYQLKETVGVSYTDVTGQTAYRLLRYRRSTDSQSWQTDSVWSVRKVNNEIIRTENGRDFVQLLVPVSNQLSWDGNRLNSLGPDTYTARNVGELYRVQGKQFDQTVMVMGQTDSTLISQTKNRAVYAREVGLIYKERINLQFCTSTPACIGRNQIDYGTQQVYRIRAYGNQ